MKKARLWYIKYAFDFIQRAKNCANKAKAASFTFYFCNHLCKEIVH